MATVSPKSTQCSRVLRLNYTGRIIDHLGLQMYQSPVAAVAGPVAGPLFCSGWRPARSDPRQDRRPLGASLGLRLRPIY